MGNVQFVDFIFIFFTSVFQQCESEFKLKFDIFGKYSYLLLRTELNDDQQLHKFWKEIPLQHL